MKEFLKLVEGDLVIYIGSMPYYLSNGQQVEKEGEELMIKSDVTVQSKFFNFSPNNKNKDKDKEEKIAKEKLAKEKEEKEKKEKEDIINQEKENQSTDVTPVDTIKDIEEMNKEELIIYADANNIDVDKRKGAKGILAEIKAAQ